MNPSPDLCNRVGLIEKIVATPVPTKGKRMALDLVLHGDLAGILTLSLNADRLSGQQKTSCEQEVMEGAGFLVAGAGFEHCFSWSERPSSKLSFRVGLLQ